MKPQRQVILYGLLSLLFFALFVWRQNAAETTARTAEAVNWDDLALSGALVTIEVADLHRTVVQISLMDGSKTVLFDLPDKAWMEGAATTPDGSLLLTYAPPPSPERPRYTQTNLYRLENGGDPHPLLAQHYPDDLFTQPAVSADGSVYFTRQQPGSNGYTLAIERYRQGVLEQIAADALWPAPSPDGQQVAYVRYDAATALHTLTAARADGTNPTPLIGEEQFTHISAPFFSPDSRHIYFAATETLTTAAHMPLFGVGETSAHGGDITLANWWRISLDGGKPERLTSLATVVQRGTFSPDGSWIAFSAVDGVYLMTAEGQQVIQVATFSAGDSIGWVP